MLQVTFKNVNKKLSEPFDPLAVNKKTLRFQNTIIVKKSKYNTKKGILKSK